MSSQQKYRVLFFGNWGLGFAGLRALVNCDNVEIVKVYSKWDKSSLNPFLNLVFDYATKNMLNVFNTAKPLAKSDFVNDIIAQEDVDYIVSCCYDRIFPKLVLSIPKTMAINVHPSVLPKYRGVKPLENAIVNGEKKIGVTIHELVPEVDAGDILLQENTIDIQENDTYGYLHSQECNLAEELIGRFFAKPTIYIRHKVPQDDKAATYAPRLAFDIKADETVKQICQRYINLVDKILNE